MFQFIWFDFMKHFGEIPYFPKLLDIQSIFCHNFVGWWMFFPSCVNHIQLFFRWWHFALVYRLELQHGFSVSVSQLEGVCGCVCLALRWSRGRPYLHARKSQVLPGGKQISWRHVWVKAVTVSPPESERVMVPCLWPQLSGPIIFTFSTCQTNQEHFDIFQQMTSSLNSMSHAK